MAEERLIKVLALLRSRFLAAVMIPGLLGIAFGWKRIPFSPHKIALVLAGLAAAGLIGLLAADLSRHRAGIQGRRLSYPALPGSPVFIRLSPGKIPLLMSLLGIVGVFVLGFFFSAAGPVVIYMAAAASLAAVCYLFDPFPYSFLAVVVFPPLLSGGVHVALSGAVDAGAFLAGIPLALILAGINLIFRKLYLKEHDFRAGGASAVLLLYSLSLCAVVVLIALHVYPRGANIASLVILSGLFFSFQIFRHEQITPVPAVTAGIGVYILAGLCLGLSLIL